MCMYSNFIYIYILYIYNNCCWLNMVEYSHLFDDQNLDCYGWSSSLRHPDMPRPDFGASRLPDMVNGLTKNYGKIHHC